MARIQPLPAHEASPAVRTAFEEHVRLYKGRITNMKATLARSLPAFEVYMQWYVLYGEVEKITGKRLAALYAWSVSYASDCPLCSTFFRKIIIDNGDDPERLQLDEKEKQLLSFGSAIAKTQGHIADHIYDFIRRYYSEDELVVLIAFAGQMIATNIFSNVTETDIDEYLLDYLKPVKIS